MNAYTTKITTDVCDCCERRGVVALTLKDGEATFGICNGCDSDTFANVAQTDIDHWLAGGSLPNA